MGWQDLVLTAANAVFLLSLIPAVFDPQKPPLTTSAPTFLAICAVCYVQLDLGLYLTTAVTAGVGLIWLVLAIQRYRQTPPTPKD